MDDKLRKAAEIALEVLEADREHITYESAVYSAALALRQALAQQALADSIRPRGKSITKVWVDEIKQAIAQPANQSDCGHKEYRPFCQMCMATKQKPEQKPVAWLEYDDEGYLFLSGKRKGAFPVFIAPSSKPWVSLTDEEKAEIFQADWNMSYEMIDIAEAKLKEKNNG